MTSFSHLEHGLQRGDEVLVGDEWYPVIGYSLRHHPKEPLSGTLFTDKKRGQFKSLGYEIDVTEVSASRRPVKP